MLKDFPRPGGFMAKTNMIKFLEQLFKAMLLWQWNYPEGHLLWKPHIFHLAGLSESFAHHNWKQNQNNFQNWPQPRCQPSQATERGRLALFVAMVQVSKMRRTSGRGLAPQVSMAGRLLAGVCLLSLSWSFAAAPYTREGHRFFAGKKSQFSAGPSWKIQRAATSAANNMDTSRSPQVLLQDAARLLREVAEVATSTGMETGLRRGLQAAQAAAATAAEVAQQPPSQVDEAFIAKVLRKLFEKVARMLVVSTHLFLCLPFVFGGRFPILLRILNWAENTN